MRDADERRMNRQGILHVSLAAVQLDNAMGATGSLSMPACPAPNWTGSPVTPAQG
ncbi:hypothetical protein [Paracoccus salsus]|uniref:hypothetical protein n=1 Tax=Paracoccus salsus TaxID=2911061 RepID=UPI001F16AB61|nr:hypothetical protein [Paracoccus salsus]MCF3973400.1 hypothetical protein [Paracoccus salsus]